MNENTTCRLGSSPADRNPDGSIGALTDLFGLAVALTATPVFLVLGARLQAIQLLWIVAVIWTIVASFVHTLWQARRHGENLDWSTRTGRYAFMRIRATHEALMRDGDRYRRDHDSDGRH